MVVDVVADDIDDIDVGRPTAAERRHVTDADETTTVGRGGSSSRSIVVTRALSLSLCLSHARPLLSSPPSPPPHRLEYPSLLAFESLNC